MNKGHSVCYSVFLCPHLVHTVQFLRLIVIPGIAGAALISDILQTALGLPVTVAEERFAFFQIIEARP